MHVAVVVRLLEDLKDGTPISRTEDEDEEGADSEGQHQVVSVDTSNILQTVWESLRDDPFSDISKEPIEVVEDSTEHMKGPWPDVPHPEKHDKMPAHFVAPPKSEVESLSTWEYLQVVWDFDAQQARVPWQNSPDVLESVHSCYKHMLDLEDQYGPWLQAKLGYWQTRNDALRQTNPHWRDAVAKDRPGVAAVLPPQYHSDVHREFLRAAGADPGVVDEILEGFRSED